MASFFVSRVDTEVDKQLKQADPRREDLLGRAGVANARAAYHRFLEIFSRRALGPPGRAAGRASSARCGRRPA